jgi:hypothetical protein
LQCQRKRRENQRKTKQQGLPKKKKSKTKENKSEHHQSKIARTSCANPTAPQACRATIQNVFFGDQTPAATSSGW